MESHYKEDSMQTIKPHRFILTRTIFVHTTSDDRPQPTHTSWRYRVIDTETGNQQGGVFDDEREALNLYFMLND